MPERATRSLRHRRPGGWLLDILADESGQTMLEYVITLILAVIPLIIFSRLMQIAIKNYIRPIYFFIGLPLP